MKKQAIAMVFAAAVACLTVAFGQDSASQEAGPAKPAAAAWQRTGNGDPLHSGMGEKFVLVGEYVKPPAQADRDAPSITVTCSGGGVLEITLDVGAAVVTIDEHTPPNYLFGVDVSVDHYGKVVLERRKYVDPFRARRKVAGKWRDVQVDFVNDQEFDPPTADGHGVNLWSAVDAESGFLDLIYGHILAHKEGKGSPVHRWVYGVLEANARQIVMQFDMPADQSEVLAACTAVDKGGHRR